MAGPQVVPLHPPTIGYTNYQIVGCRLLREARPAVLAILLNQIWAICWRGRLLSIVKGIGPRVGVNRLFCKRSTIQSKCRVQYGLFCGILVTDQNFEPPLNWSFK